LLVGLGRADSYACKIEWLERQGRPGPRPSPDAKVKVGDEVVTSGLGASFPAGLVVGKVSKIIGDDGMFQSVEVTPTVDVSRVRAVMVLLAPPPPPDPDAKSRRRSEPAFGARPL
jgi:rod shape-determining protein MreC